MMTKKINKQIVVFFVVSTRIRQNCSGKLFHEMDMKMQKKQAYTKTNAHKAYVISEYPQSKLIAC